MRFAIIIVCVGSLLACTTEPTPEPVLGRSCDLGARVPAGHVGGVLIGDAGCDDAVCAYVVELEAPAVPCAQDDDCRVPGAWIDFVCIDGVCAASPDSIAEHSRCTTTCETSEDCGAVAASTTCNTEFVCANVVTEGPECCEKHCVCAEDISAGPDDIAAACRAGTLAGCCDQDPPPPGCG
jgi:hypothetical protein